VGNVTVAEGDADSVEDVDSDDLPEAQAGREEWRKGGAEAPPEVLLSRQQRHGLVSHAVARSDRTGLVERDFNGHGAGGNQVLHDRLAVRDGYAVDQSGGAEARG
jgi:hypothetical protein